MAEPAFNEIERVGTNNLTPDALPTMYDLPCEHPEDELPDHYHVVQPQLLSETFRPPGLASKEVFTATDLYLYYDPEHTNWYKRPDWMAVLEPNKAFDDVMRLSYVIWQEKVPPYIAIEILSPGTENEDLGLTSRLAGRPPTKWQVYEQILQIPYYATFDRITGELRFHALRDGRYVQQLEPEDRYWLPEAGLGLGIWQGSFLGHKTIWLRFYDESGAWIPCKDELLSSKDELLSSKDETLARMAAKLRELGIDPESI